MLKGREITMSLLLFANMVSQEISPECRIIVWYVGEHSAQTYTAKELRKHEVAKQFYVDEMCVIDGNAVFVKAVR